MLHNDHIKTVALTQQLSFLEVWSVDLPWWSNLTWCNDKQQIRDMCKEFRSWCSTVFSMSWKTQRMSRTSRHHGIVRVCNVYIHGRRRGGGSPYPAFLLSVSITPAGGAWQEMTLTASKLEMHSWGPAARPGPKFRHGRAFCGARTKSAGLMPGSGEANTMYYALAAGLRAVLEKCWPGSMLGSADFVRCRSGLGLGFWIIFCISTPNLLVLGDRLWPWVYGIYAKHGNENSNSFGNNILTKDILSHFRN